MNLGEIEYRGMRLDDTTKMTVALRLSTEGYTRAMESARVAFAGFARAVHRAAWRVRFAEFHAIGMTRPDGRSRRTGHRHRGTRAWERRHG